MIESIQDLMYLVHHIFLPAQLPQYDDEDATLEDVLLRTISEALQAFQTLAPIDKQSGIQKVKLMLDNTRLVRASDSSIDQKKLRLALQSLSKQGGTLPLHIKAQNAGLIISRIESEYYFDPFELTPLNEAVMGTKGRLKRHFPACTVSLNSDTFNENGFQETLAQTVAKMSHQSVAGMQPTIVKGGNQMSEVRDTADPSLVTEHLVSFIQAAGGQPVQVSGIWKHTREDVLWNQTYKPWHRSALWLLVRVSMQLSFFRSSGGNPTDCLYKQFMVFLMSHVLTKPELAGIESDFIYCMTAKISRRLLKLEGQLEPWNSTIEQAMSSGIGRLEARWKQLNRKDLPFLDLQCLRHIAPLKDVLHVLGDLDAFIASIHHRKEGLDTTTFRAEECLPYYPSERLPSDLDDTVKNYRCFDLCAFETWVENSLGSWLQSHLLAQETCGQIRSTIQNYYSRAHQYYSKNPEGYSVMLLTIMELWVACDQSACAIHELLRDYDPEIPVYLLAVLVLPFQTQLDRLFRVERYLEDRKVQSERGMPSILRTFGGTHSFSVRYFDQSSKHQDLFNQVETEASRDRQAKKEELRRKQTEYHDLMRRYDNSDCEFGSVLVDKYSDFWEQRHCSSCLRCLYKSQAQSITIDLHEWPLPKRATDAKSTVFELDVPVSFAAWRDATTFLVIDVFGRRYETERKPDAEHRLGSYHGLRNFYQEHGTQRIGLLSQVKSHTRTHRRNQNIANTYEYQVCVEHGLRWSYFDSFLNMFAEAFKDTDKITKLCAYKMPERSRSMGKFLLRPHTQPNGRPPNHNIAEQALCPEHIGLDEWEASASLLYGYWLQWQNILRQLAMPVVDFAKIETRIILLQASNQVGVSEGGSDTRPSHQVLEDEVFGRTLLYQLQAALGRVQKNWDSSHALAGFIHLAARLLSCTCSQSIQDSCLSFLSAAREVAFGWMHLLRGKTLRTLDNAQRKELLTRTFDTALICNSSFDVDDRYLTKLLLASPSASAFIESSMTIQECLCSTNKSKSSLELLLPIMLDRWKKLSYRALPLLSSSIVEAQSVCLDGAISRWWSAFVKGCQWRAISSPHKHWLVSETIPTGSSTPLSVHFNLLTSELLVNGRPLARFPQKYEKHPTYRILFSDSTMEALPSSVAGMEFSTKVTYAGYTTHMGLQKSTDRLGSTVTDLLIQARQGDSRWDLIPSRLFHGKLPAAFVDDFVHWFEHASGSIELRPINEPWQSSSLNWRLKRSGRSWRMVRDGVALVNIHSETGRTISSILSPLEIESYVHIFVKEQFSSIEVGIPRFRLGFFLDMNDGSLHSQQFKGMVIDPDQGMGTLIGLQNKLMLRSLSVEGDRMVIVPDGQITYERTDGHTRVSVSQDHATFFHVYHINNRLERLDDNGTMYSKLMLCYLHALTSYCLPDALTKTTGTEQALDILQSASVRSFDLLTQRDLDMLKVIAGLAPVRNFYPRHLKVMQTVHWNSNLGFLSQHGKYETYVREIFEQSKIGEIFHSDSYVKPPELDGNNPHLLGRDFIRSSTFRISRFGAEHHTTKSDVRYRARDVGQNSTRASNSFVAASAICHRGAVLKQADLPHGEGFLWKPLLSASPIIGYKLTALDGLLAYDSKWLDDPASFLGNIWCSAHYCLRQGPEGNDKFRLMMWFATMAFSKYCDLNILHALVAFYSFVNVARIEFPISEHFDLARGIDIDINDLHRDIRPSLYNIERCPERSLARIGKETSSALKQRRMREHRQKKQLAASSFVSTLHRQWPCEVPRTPNDDDVCIYINMDQAMEVVREEFRVRYNNLLFHRYLTQIETLLRSVSALPANIPRCGVMVSEPPSTFRKRYVNEDELFVVSTPICLPKAFKGLVMPEALPSLVPQETKLDLLLDRLESNAVASDERVYLESLRTSCLYLKEHLRAPQISHEGCPNRAVLSEYLLYCKAYVDELFLRMKNTLEKENSYQLATMARQTPRVSTIFFLKRLRFAHRCTINRPWKDCIISYGLALTEVQRAERLLALATNHADLVSELSNIGHTNWSPHKHPDSLLLEIESDIMIRPNQEEIAQQMRSPPSEDNAVAQLNMGEGKTSCIVPAVAVDLADGKNLFRVLVPKPQAKQMAETLTAKVSRLLDRRVYYMPFSRALRLSKAQADAIWQMCKDCVKNRGILLVQPEHILSLKLMSIECSATDRESIGHSLLQIQDFFHSHSRDLVDESDENFSVKFELVYTMGTQRPIELSPQRWSIIHHILALVTRFAHEVKSYLPDSIAVDDRWPDRIPRIRLLRDDAENMLLERVARHICETGFPGFPVAQQTEATKQAILKYILKPELSQKEISQVEDDTLGNFGTDLTQDILLLVRGLIAGNVLAFALRAKRWRVNYGLYPNRFPPTRLAVPFRAKDHPAPRAEFSHPDVVLVLTSLSYYYEGLTDDQLLDSFTHLLKSDQAELEYSEWIRDSPGLPDGFRQLSGINIKDRIQCTEEIFPQLKFSKGAIDYFLSHLVLSKEIREFPHKLSASGWDLAEVKENPTTGFSGTNDSQYVLPLNIEQLDLPNQRHTNALVLHYLLQDENTVHLLSEKASAQSDAEHLLEAVTRLSPEVRVILDVGAQVLEYKNDEMARAWLAMVRTENIKAAVFVDDRDELCVLDRKGRTELLQTSPFAKQLDACLIFLDDAHTRGIDLKLPSYYRAAVTLGASLTKDRLVQACMRMRKLGKGQSVVFCIPPEIQRKICECTTNLYVADIEVLDVLQWLVHETCLELRRSMPLWFAQGLRFEKQRLLWQKIDGKMSQEAAKTLLETEALSLKQRYQPLAQSDMVQDCDLLTDDTARMIDRCRSFNSMDLQSANLQEEQERELSPEIEREREVERPEMAEPEIHSVHPQVKAFVKTGSLVASAAFVPAFQSLCTTSASQHLDVRQFPQNILVTADFARTVRLTTPYCSDAYQRSVQWILTGANSMVIISPYEAQELLPDVVKLNKVTMHVYAPRLNLSFAPLDALDLFTQGKPFGSIVCPQSVIHLNLFAGQLYFGSFCEYTEVSSILGLAAKPAAETAQADECEQKQYGSRISHIKFFKTFLAKVRGNCQDIGKTHMGKMLDGVLLREDDFRDLLRISREGREIRSTVFRTIGRSHGKPASYGSP